MGLRTDEEDQAISFPKWSHRGPSTTMLEMVVDGTQAKLGRTKPRVYRLVAYSLSCFYYYIVCCI